MNGSGRASGWLGPAALIVAVFVSGALTGAAGMRWLGQEAQEGQVAEERARDRGREGPRDGRTSRHFLDQVSERLDLTAEQQDRIDSIIQDHRQRSREVMEGIRPRLGASLDSMNAAIAEVLEPAQREAWTEFLQEANERRRDDRRRGGGRRDGPPRGR